MLQLKPAAKFVAQPRAVLPARKAQGGNAYRLRRFLGTVTGAGLFSAFAKARGQEKNSSYIVVEQPPLQAADTRNPAFEHGNSRLHGLDFRTTLQLTQRLISLKWEGAREFAKMYGIMGAVPSLCYIILSEKFQELDNQRFGLRNWLKLLALPFGITAATTIYGAIYGWSEGKKGQKEVISDIAYEDLAKLYAQREELGPLISNVLDSWEYRDGIGFKEQEKFDPKDFAWFEQSLYGAITYLHDRTAGRRSNEANKTADFLRNLKVSRQRLEERTQS